MNPVSLPGLVAGARFFARLPVYLHRRLDLPEARALLARRLEQREARFLDRLRTDVYSRPSGVYARLLRHAGCEYGDIERLVKTGGVEGALERLFAAGVYLSVDEYKGRKPVVRGTLHIEAGPERLRSPRAAYHLPGASGGSRSGGTPVLMDLRFVRDCAGNCALCLDAWGGANWRKGDYETPGAGARFRLVKFAAFGRLPEAWFSQVHPADPALAPIARWNTRAMRLASTLAGRPLPAPVHAPLYDPAPVAEWLSSVLRAGDTPHLFTFPGSAVRVCLAAEQKGIEIAGARFMLAGEPITEARVATVRRSGCVAIPRYGTVETGAIAYGCPNGEHSDDVHVLRDMHALIQAGDDNPAGLPPTGILLTLLHPRSPFLMINVSMGDQAQVGERDCGCPLYNAGWTTRLYEIRSFEKLTGGGVTFLGTDVIRILEELLPAKFGGAATDYQLVEEEAPDGRPLLLLVAHPALGPIEESRLTETFYAALGELSDYSAAMTRRWRDANTLQVARRPPSISRAGKILHLHASGKVSPPPPSP
ncbi:MAG: hypothetical protein KIT09_17325 [Bryobacteraceae bacterium]|nr:hypothetical protein [Bryobacteraceae bacterium]